jgi:hypothetical protein
VIDEDELRQMSDEQRRELARALAAIDLPHPMLDPSIVRRRHLGLMFMMGCCVVLAAWIAYLALTLPKHYTSSHWRGAWIGLDAAELAGFAATAWASWHQRQVIIFCMIFTGTLLIADAWFDLALDYGSSGFTMSVISACVAELPLAFLLFAGARRLVRMTVETVMRLEGIEGPVPPLWQVPLFADGLDAALPARLRDRNPAMSRPGGLSRHEWREYQRLLCWLAGGRPPAPPVEPLRGVPAADVLDRLPDDRQRR